VIDNSNSMELEQSLLAAGFDAFIANIDKANIDFQIGVITTDFEPPRVDATTGETLDERGKLRGGFLFCGSRTLNSRMELV